MTALAKITKKRQKDLLELFGYVWDENLEKCRKKFPVRKDYQKFRLEQYLSQVKTKETERNEEKHAIISQGSFRYPKKVSRAFCGESGSPERI